MNLFVLYRGSLTSCNYGCGYCPFAKRHETEEQLRDDRESLARFGGWLRRQTGHRWQVLFTPWGESLVRSWYREAVTALSHIPHVEMVAVQTNLSCGLSWLKAARRDRLALWVTYHPTETDHERFLTKVRTLRGWGIRLSVGMVGVTEFLPDIEAVRRLLPDDVYLWINAQQPRPRPYSAQEEARFNAVDPLFSWTARRMGSRGLPCRTGELAFTVDGAGDMRRCHSVDGVIGNIDSTNWEQALRPRRCSNRFCDCFLGQSQLQADSLLPFFGETLGARLPEPDFSFRAIQAPFSVFDKIS